MPLHRRFQYFICKPIVGVKRKLQIFFFLAKITEERINCRISRGSQNCRRLKGREEISRKTSDIKVESSYQSMDASTNLNIIFPKDWFIF